MAACARGSGPARPCDRARSGQCGRAVARAVAENVLRDTTPLPARLDKGSHIVVRRLFDHDRAYIVQTADGRVCVRAAVRAGFHIDRNDRRGLRGDPSGVQPSADEIDYLCEVVNALFPRHHRSRRRGLGICRAFARSTTTARKRSRGQPRLSARARRTQRRGAAADRLWRQDHHLSAARGGCARQARAYRCRRPGVDGGTAPAGRRFRPNAREALVAQDAQRTAVSGRGPCAAAGARLWHARRARPRAGARSWRIWGRASAPTSPVQSSLPDGA